MYNYLTTLIRVIEPRDGACVVGEVRVYADAWLEFFYNGCPVKSYQSDRDGK